MLPLRPRIPDGPVAIELTGLIDVHTKAQFWARLATGASVVTAFTFLALAMYREVAWLVALPFFLFPLVPIAAENRLAEIRRIIERQLLDAMAERAQADETAAPGA